MAARVDDRPQLHGVLASGAQLGEERIVSKGAALALESGDDDVVVLGE